MRRGAIRPRHPQSDHRTPYQLTARSRIRSDGAGVDRDRDGALRSRSRRLHRRIAGRPACHYGARGRRVVFRADRADTGGVTCRHRRSRFSRMPLNSLRPSLAMTGACSSKHRAARSPRGCARGVRRSELPANAYCNVREGATMKLGGEPSEHDSTRCHNAHSNSCSASSRNSSGTDRPESSTTDPYPIAFQPKRSRIVSRALSAAPRAVSRRRSLPPNGRSN
jgi:hypothetical protein